jgi:hypothetical protein
MAPERLLVVGVERSGTTWAAKALAAAMEATYVHEPDSPGASIGAKHARQFGKYPVVSVGDPAPLYAEDWDVAFRGGLPAPQASAAVTKTLKRIPAGVRDPLVSLASRLVQSRKPKARVVAKSVMCAFSLDWIIDRYNPPVVWVRRHPFNVVASLIELGTTVEGMERLYTRYRDPILQARLVRPLGLPELPDDLDLMQQCAYWVGLNAAGYFTSLKEHGDFVLADHDRLCEDPSARFTELCEQLGISWNSTAEEFVASSNREGEGFSTNRVTALEPERWRRTLADREAELQAILEQFPGALPD